MACRVVGTKPLSELTLEYCFRNKLQWNFNRNSNLLIQENSFESVVCEMAAICFPHCNEERVCFLCVILDRRVIAPQVTDNSTVCSSLHGSDHEGATVLLPGFAINW